LDELGEHFSAVVYYIDEPDGFHVVVTTQQRPRDKAAVARSRQYWRRASRPRFPYRAAAGEVPVRIVFSNAGDHLHIAEPTAFVTAQ
jgi:hypothetical protein